MTNDQIIALVGAAVLAFIVRVFNVVVEWLSRILGVRPPEPIPVSHDDIDHTAPPVISSKPEAPDPG